LRHATSLNELSHAPFNIFLEGSNTFIHLRKYHHTLESVVPHMPHELVPPVIRAGEHTQDPLHDSGKLLLLSRLHDQMDMVAHNAEIDDCKIVTGLRAPEYIEEQILCSLRVENKLPAVY
jgi:hypothetical protein